MGFKSQCFIAEEKIQKSEFILQDKAKDKKEKDR